jgi:hypothetical protein
MPAQGHDRVNVGVCFIVAPEEPTNLPGFQGVFPLPEVPKLVSRHVEKHLVRAFELHDVAQVKTVQLLIYIVGKGKLHGFINANPHHAIVEGVPVEPHLRLGARYNVPIIVNFRPRRLENESNIPLQFEVFGYGCNKPPDSLFLPLAKIIQFKVHGEASIRQEG